MTTRIIQDWEKDNDYDFDTSVEILRKIAVDDYVTYCSRRERGEFTDDAYFQKRINEFDEKLVINNRGSKYVKLISDRSVWGFVVKKDSDKFKRGDILNGLHHGLHQPLTRLEETSSKNIRSSNGQDLCTYETIRRFNRCS